MPVIITNPKDKAILDSLIEFFVDVGFINEARRLGERCFNEYKQANADRVDRAIKAQHALSKENEKAAHKGVDGVGQCEQRLDPAFKAEVIRMFGNDAIEDEKFMKGVERDNNFNFKPTYERKATMIVDKTVQDKSTN